ncbi:MAG: hypothetical protein U0L43_05615, partial [Muribaculaceae bacterium]|nr:hypothetical protein [Muribaculaceae bacterium]
LNMMLFGNPDYIRIPEKDLKYLEQDEAMQSALSKFIVKGAVNEFTERLMILMRLIHHVLRVSCHTPLTQ